MKFGSGIRTGMNPQNTMYSMNSSLFKLDGNSGAKNMFVGVNTNQSFNFNGVNYDNAYAMLNSVGDGSNAKNEGGINFGKVKDLILKGAGALGGVLDKGIETIGKFGKKVGEVATKSANGIKSGINKLFGKKDKGQENNVGKALDNLKNAQDKETLTQALDGAKVEQQANAQKGVAAEKAEKAAEKGKAEADKKADISNKKLEEDKTQLDNDNKALDQAKADVQTAKASLDAATQGVAQAEQALSQAKSAATSDNPNTAAINAAEQQLKAAKEKESQAKEDLTAAENAQTDAQKKVDDQTGVVKDSETENTQAQEGVKSADQEVKTTQQETQVVQTEAQQIDEGVQEGEQRLEQMETSPATDGTQSATNPDGTPVSQNTDGTTPATGGLGNNMSLEQPNVYEKDGQYYVNGFQTNEEMYNAAQNMDQNVVNAGFSPGSTTDVYVNGQDDPVTFSVQGGKYMVNGQEVSAETFVNEYNSAKANQESGSESEISLINDDYSKYRETGSGNNNNNISSNNKQVRGGSKQSSGTKSTQTASNPQRPPANESGNGQVDPELAAKNKRQNDAEWAAYVASRKTRNK